MRRGPGAPSPYRYIGATARSAADGWESLGDIGHVDADGYVYITDRLADMILVGGANVYPAEIEAALDEHPAVQSSCVIGLPDEELGSIPYAIVELSEPVSDEDLMAHLRQRLAPYKLPRVIERATTPLRDDAGKVRRSALRAERIARHAAVQRTDYAWDAGDMTDAYWALAVARDDLSRTALVEGAVPGIGDGEALLRVDRVGLTANNVTYAVLGESFRYWDSSRPNPGWGMVPLWGFADIVASAVAGVAVGGRVYGTCRRRATWWCGPAGRMRAASVTPARTAPGCRRRTTSTP